MAGGEFLHLLASLERREKAKVDAKAKVALAVNLADKQERSSAQLASLKMKNRTDMYLLNDALRDKTLLKKEIKDKESSLEELGVIINQHNSLKPEDLTEEGTNILEFTYTQNVEDLNNNQLQDKSVSNTIELLTEQNNARQEKIDSLNEHLKKLKNVDNALKNMSQQFFEPEFEQIGEGKINEAWVVDDIEMAKFIEINRADYDSMVKEFGGDETEVQLRLRNHFSQYSKEQMQVLSDVLQVKGQEANIAKINKAINAMPTAAGKVAEAQQKMIDEKIKEFNAVMNQSGNDFTDAQIKDNPMLYHIDGQPIPQAAGTAGYQAFMKGIETGMSGFMKELDSFDWMAQDVNANLREDPRALALYYTGQIVDMKEWIKNNPKQKDSKPDFKDKSGTKYMYVSDTNTQVKYAEERINKLDVEPGAFGNSDLAVNGIIRFFRQYAEAHRLSDEIYNLQNFSLTSINHNSSPMTGSPISTSFKNRLGEDITEDEFDQDSLDENQKILDFIGDFNVSVDTLSERAKDSGWGNDITGYVEDYRRKVSKPTFNMKESERKSLYADGDLSASRGAEIIKRLDEIEKAKSQVAKDWLNADGDDQLQRERRSLFDNQNYMGEEWEMLHEEGATLVDDLKEIRDLAASLGDSGLWDFYLEEQIGEDTVIGKKTEDLGFWRKHTRGVLQAPVINLTQIEHLLAPLEEEDIIVEATKGRGLASMYKHRDRQLKMALEYIDRQEANAPPMWFETADDSLYDNVEKQLNQNAGIYSLDEVIVTPE